MLKRSTLKRAAKNNPKGLRRLAKFLRLKIDSMSNKQVANLVAWRLHRNRFI